MSIRALLNNVQRWRHAGEEGAIIVFRRRFVARLVFQFCGSVALPLIVSPPPQRLLTFTILAVFLLPRTVADGRRAYIFTLTEVIYRPPFGPPRRAQMSQIAVIKRSKVSMFVSLEVDRVPGVVLTLTSGEKQAWPLDFKEKSEILQHLSAATGRAITD